MNYFILFTITSLLCCHFSLEQSTGEVVLDTQGITFDDFEVLAQQLAKNTFTGLTDDSVDKEALAQTFGKNLALSITNLVIYVNNQGFQDVPTIAREITSVLEAALTSSVASSPPQFKAFDKEIILSTVETTVTDTLLQLQEGKGINDVVNYLANPILQVSFSAVKRLIHILEHPEVAEVQKSGPLEPKSKTTNTTSVAKTFTDQQDEVVATPELEDFEATSQEGTVVYIPESGEFTFNGEGKAVSQLKEQIIMESEPGFVIMQNANLSDVPAVVKSFAANLTQVIGEVLLTVLNAEDDVDKETEAEAISDAVGSALLVVVENTSGNLKSIDVTFIQNEIVAAAFNAITSSAEPDADINAILQTAVEQVMQTIEDAFIKAMVPLVEADAEGEDGELYIEHKDSVKEESVKEEREPEPTVSTNGPATVDAQAQNGNVVEVSSSSSITFEEVQNELSSAFLAAFTAVEEEPTATSTQSATKDLLYAIAKAIGQTFVSLFPEASPEDQVQVVVGLLYGGMQSAVQQTTGPLSAFDVAGVISTIQTGASEIFDPSLDKNLQTKLQELAGLAIDTIVAQLTEIVPDFTFKAKVEFGSSSSSSTTQTSETQAETPTESASEEVVISEPVEERPVAKSAIQSQQPQVATTIEPEATPLSTPEDTSPVDAEPEAAPLTTSEVVDVRDSCLCFDAETFEAVVDSRVEAKIEQILKEKRLI